MREKRGLSQACASALLLVPVAYSRLFVSDPFVPELVRKDLPEPARKDVYVCRAFFPSLDHAGVSDN
jgi:undecaprenyl pyrophosphate synthase